MLIIFAWGPLPVGAGTAEEPPAKVTYEDHIRPIFRQHCFTCHDTDKRKGDLALDSFAATMAGGASGEVVEAGDSSDSRLWHLINHEDTPEMPPEQDKLPEDQLALIQKWLDLGALENAGSTARVKKKASYALELSSTTGKPEGPPPMPEGLSRAPVVHAPRAGQITALATSPWAPLAAVAGQRQVLLYHTESAELVGVLPFPEGIPHVLRFSRSGTLLLVGGGHAGAIGKVALFDVRSGRRIVTVGDERDVVLAADINGDHTRIALGGPRRVVRIYSTDDGELLHEIRKHTDWVTAIEFSPDGALLATADRGAGLMVWEAETAREFLNLQGHKGEITSLSWRADSRILASASEDGQIKLWEVVHGKPIESWEAHQGARSVHYARDGRLVTAGRDTAVIVWDGEGKRLAKFSAFESLTLEARFSHDGTRVIGGDWLGEVRLWKVDGKPQVRRLSANPPTLQMRVNSTEAEAE